MSPCSACVLSCPVLLPGLSAGDVVEDAVAVDKENAVTEELADSGSLNVRVVKGGRLLLLVLRCDSQVRGDVV